MAFASDGTGYTTVARSDGTYEVQVIAPAGVPQSTERFKTEAEAEQWILQKIAAKPGGDLPPIIEIA